MFAVLYHTLKNNGLFYGKHLGMLQTMPYSANAFLQSNAVAVATSFDCTISRVWPHATTAGHAAATPQSPSRPHRASLDEHYRT